MRKTGYLIILSIIFLISSSAFAADNNDIYWNLAVVKLDKHNNTLLNMAGSERTARRQYNEAVTDAQYVNTDGLTITFGGEKYYIKFEQQTQMLLTQQKELLPEQMKLSWELTRDNGSLVRNAMIMGLRNLYLGLYNADNDRKLNMKKYELAQNMYRQDIIRQDRGLISDLDLSESEYNLLKAKKSVEASERIYENMLRSFNSYIGLEPDTEYNEIKYDEQFNEKRLKQYEEYFNKAMTRRLEIIEIDKQLSLFEKQKSIMDRYPKMLSIPTVRKDYDDVLLQIDILSIKLESVKLEIEKEIKEAFVEVDAARKNVINMKSMLDLQGNSLENTIKRYQNGMISKNVLDQAQIAYDSLDNNYKAVLFDYNTKLMKLEYASGIGPGY